VEATTWNCRPSDLVNLDDDYLAYCLDQAVGYVGRAIQAELDKVEAKTESEAERKRKLVFERFFGDTQKPSRGLYADPAAMLK
jgi:hypothetical protein